MTSVIHSKRRWPILISFAMVAMVSQMLWLNFAPIVTLIQKRYNVTEDIALLLTVVFPFLYVVLSIPAGLLIDKKGYRYSVSIGGVVQGLASLIRIYDESFAALLVGQIGIAIAQ